MDPCTPAAALAQRVALLRGRLSPVLGIDGRSGSGKSTLAHACAAVLRGQLPARRVEVLHLDDLYRGWSGLQGGLDAAAELLATVRSGSGAAVPRWDWTRDRPGAPLELAPGGVVVLEGCGAGSDTLAPHVDVLAWLEVERSTRRERVLRRDGRWEVTWESWEAQEDEVLSRRDARAAAHLVVHG